MKQPRADDTVHSSETDATVVSDEVPQPAGELMLEGWDRYRIERELGAGGMGRVFLATDLRLRRPVALKFLRAADPELLERFLHEAQAQARVDHEHICKVYEVGEVHDQHYIAMQFVDGVTLRKAAPAMPLRQRMEILRRVAEALHAAHRQGLVHRDVKPSNVLVEETDAGPKPYVTDFGLARTTENAGLTKTGIAIGTPHYMSPEQARGVSEVDARSDVYGLGATGYEVLTGQPPFRGEGAMEVLVQVLGDEPVAPRRLDASIPVDLETIVLKCLEKNPARRYGTARELGEDLDRWLDGEPIRAHPPSLAYRLGKKAHKNRGIVAVAAVSLAVLSVGGWTAIHQRRTAAERARLAQHLGQEVESTAVILRQAILLPPHDIRREKAVIRQRMQAIEAEMRRLGALAEGPGHYALGRGHFALGEHRQAREHLETAWRAGFRTPEASFALAETLSAAYATALQQAERIGGREARQARRAELEQTLRRSILGYLKTSGGARDVSPAYLEALIASYEGRYDDALAGARAEQSAEPLDHRAHLLEAQVHARLGLEKRASGDADGALAEYALAGQALERAKQIARSDPSVYFRDCERRNFEFILRLSRGRPAQETLDGALAACGEALAIDPENAGIDACLADLHWRWAEYQMTHGEDPVQALDRSVEHARRSSTLTDANSAVWDTLGNALVTRAEWESRHGGKPEPWFAQAIAAYDKAARIFPGSPQTLSNLCLANEEQGEWAMANGRDPRPAFARAAAACEQAVKTNPRYGSALGNLGNVLDAQAEWELAHGLDAAGTLARAIATYDRAIALQPYFRYYSNRAGSYLQKASWALARGEDPGEALATARQSARKALELKADHAQSLAHLAASWRLEAVHQLERGEDPSRALAETRAAAAQALTIDPGRADAQVTQAEADLVEAKWAAHQGGSPDRATGRGLAALARAAAKQPKSAGLWRAAARLHLWRAGRGGPHDVAEGLAAAERALAIDPASAEARAIRGSLALERARRLRDEAAAKAAAADIADAIERNRWLSREYGRRL